MVATADQLFTLQRILGATVGLPNREILWAFPAIHTAGQASSGTRSIAKCETLIGRGKRYWIVDNGQLRMLSPNGQCPIIFPLCVLRDLGGT